MDLARDINLNEPMLSIIIPVYNVENYLRECVDSIVIQNNGLIEVILVNDGSEDSSGTICNEYSAQYSWINTIHQVNSGSGVARNNGILQSKGKYIWYVDSDDLIASGAISILFSILYKDLDLIMFSAKSFSDGAEIIMNYDRTDKIGEVDFGKEILRSNMSHNAYISSVCMRVYKKAFIDRIGLSFGEERMFEDEQYAFISLYEAKTVLTIREVLYLRRYRQGSKMYYAQKVNEDSYRLSYEGYGDLAKTFVSLYEEKYKNDEEKYRWVFLLEATDYYKVILGKYCLLNRREKKRHRDDLLELRDIIIKYKDKMSLKSRLAIENINLYSIYKKTKHKLNIILKKIIR